MHSEGGRALGSRTSQGHPGSRSPVATGQRWAWGALETQDKANAVLQAGAMLRHGLSSCLAYLEHLHAIYL